MDAVALLERQRNAERRKWLAAGAFAFVAIHTPLMLQYLAGDVLFFLIPWYQHIMAHGRIGVFDHVFANYTPPYLYLLSATTLFDGLLEPFYLIKLLSWVGMIWLIVATHRLFRVLGRDPTFALAIALLPSVAANTSMLGQADTFWVAPCVLALAAAVRERWFWVAFWSGVAFAFKAQAVFFAPFVVHLFITRRVPWTYWLVPAAVYAAAMFPAWLVGWPAWDLATIYLRQAAWQPEDGTIYIANGASWWTWFGYISDTTAIRFFWFGFLTSIVAVVAYLRFVPLDGVRRLILAAIVSSAGLPFLLPGMHERFYMLADVLAFIYAVAFPSRRSITAAVLFQVASALPVYVWAMQLEPLNIVAPAFAIGAMVLFLREMASPAELMTRRAPDPTLQT